MSHREEHIRDVAVILLSQLKDRFPQVVLYWKNYSFISLFPSSHCHWTPNTVEKTQLAWMQVLWNSSCVDSLLFSIHNDSSSTVVNDPGWVVTVRSLYQKIVREWIIKSLSYAPCSSQGLLQVDHYTFYVWSQYKYILIVKCVSIHVVCQSNIAKWYHFNQCEPPLNDNCFALRVGTYG